MTDLTLTLISILIGVLVVIIGALTTALFVSRKDLKAARGVTGAVIERRASEKSQQTLNLLGAMVVSVGHGVIKGVHEYRISKAALNRVVGRQVNAAPLPQGGMVITVYKDA